MNEWVFGCILSLRQETCGRYERDTTARGHGRWGGCPSCRYRRAGNKETARAESTWYTGILATQENKANT